jgi:hypothetical protein
MVDLRARDTEFANFAVSHANRTANGDLHGERCEILRPFTFEYSLASKFNNLGRRDFAAYRNRYKLTCHQVAEPSPIYE